MTWRRQAIASPQHKKQRAREGSGPQTRCVEDIAADMLVIEYRPPKATALIHVVYEMCDGNAVSCAGSTAETVTAHAIRYSEAYTSGCETRDRSQVPMSVALV